MRLPFVSPFNLRPGTVLLMMTVSVSSGVSKCLLQITNHYVSAMYFIQVNKTVYGQLVFSLLTLTGIQY